VRRVTELQIRSRRASPQGPMLAAYANRGGLLMARATGGGRWACTIP